MIYTPFYVTLGLFPFIVFGPACLFLNMYVMFACTGLLEEASMLASTVTFVTYVRGVPASNLGRDIDNSLRLFSIFFCSIVHSHHTNARIVSYGDDGSVFACSF